MLGSTISESSSYETMKSEEERECNSKLSIESKKSMGERISPDKKTAKDSRKTMDRSDSLSHHTMEQEEMLSAASSNVAPLSQSTNKDMVLGTCSEYLDPSIIYFLSPVSIISTITSPYRCFYHLAYLAIIVLFVIFSRWSHQYLRRTVLLVFGTSCILWNDLSHLLPLVIVLCIGSSTSTSNKSFCDVWLGLGILCIRILLYQENEYQKDEFFPGFGVNWYLYGEAFSKYANYFAFLIRMQPCLFALPLALRLPNMPIVTALVMLGITLLVCSDQASYFDIVFVLCAFLSQRAVVKNMRLMPIFGAVVCLFVSMIGVPFTLLHWIKRGTGNANFVFFLGLGGMVALIVIIVEFTRSAMRIRGNASASQFELCKFFLTFYER